MALKRLDLHLVENGLALSRTHAQELIDAKQVFLLLNEQKKLLTKSSLKVSEKDNIIVEQGPANRFISRGGLKLEGALHEVSLSVQGFDILDVGLSTGGFADCLLKAQAKSLVGVDVGHGQIHASLLQDKRLTALEGINARNLSENPEFLKKSPLQKFDLIVMDVSFISICLIIPGLVPLLNSDGLLLSLVKPQFEVGVDGLARGGIVKDASLYEHVEKKVKSSCEEAGLEVLKYFSSSILGKDGNREFFVYARKS